MVSVQTTEYLSTGVVSDSPKELAESCISRKGDACYSSHFMFLGLKVQDRRCASKLAGFSLQP